MSIVYNSITMGFKDWDPRPYECPRYLRELGEFCVALDPHANEIISRYARRGTPPHYGGVVSFEPVESGSLFIKECFVVPDGALTIALVHEEEQSAAAFMTMDFSDYPDNSSLERYLNEHRHEGVLRPTMLWVTQLQGQLKSKKSESCLITNPVTRIAWERLFLDVSVEFARHIGMSAVGVFPPEASWYFTHEEKLENIRKAGEDARAYRLENLNKRLINRYRGTPHQMGWQKMFDHPHAPYFITV